MVNKTYRNTCSEHKRFKVFLIPPLYYITTYKVFKVKRARVARNPKTGEPIAIPKRSVPHFAAGEIFKSTVA